MANENNIYQVQIPTGKVKTYYESNGVLHRNYLDLAYISKNSSNNISGDGVYFLTDPAEILHENIKLKKAILTVGATIVSENASYYKIGLFRVSGDIGEDVTVPEYSENIIDYEFTSATKEEHTLSFDITRLINKSTIGRLCVDNIMLKLIGDINSATVKVFDPRIDIQYETSHLTNDSYNTNTHSIGRFGQGSIDLLTGKLEFFSQDFSWSGRRLPVTINHRYNSALSNYRYSYNDQIDITDADFGLMNVGLGWKINLMQSMHCIPESDGWRWIYTDENGFETHFKACDETVECDAGSSETYKLFKSQDDRKIYYDDYRRKIIMDNREYYFDAYLRFIGVSDKYSSMSIEYDENQIRTVTDGAGREFIFHYDDNDFLTSITAPDGSQVVYGYIDDLLTSISYPDGTNAIITYNFENKPKNIILKNDQNDLLYKVAYVFDGDRVVSISEFAVKDGEFVQGTTSAYNYDSLSNQTTVVSIIPKDDDETEDTVITTVYSFDDNGDMVGQYSYDSTGIKNQTSLGSGINPLPSLSNVESNVDNLLINHDFKDLTNWELSNVDCKESAVAIFTDEEFSKYGKRVVALQAHDDVYGTELYQDTVLLPKGEYTFSAYVKPSIYFDSGNNGGGMYLEVLRNGQHFAESERITGNSTEYVRVVTSFSLIKEESVRVKLCVQGNGTVYFNAPQLENNPNANQYNLLTNSNFEHELNVWELTGDAQLSSTENFNMSHSLCLTSNINSKSSAKQTIDVKSFKSMRETFVLSGWAKAFGLPVRDRGIGSMPEFNLSAVIKYKDENQTTETHTVDFSPCTDAWQPASIVFAKEKYLEIDSISIECNYGYNYGSAFFDDIRLFRTNIETGLSEADFVSQEVEDNYYYTEEEKDVFEETKDEYGNIVTSTHFADGEFGTIYSSYNYVGNNEETDNVGNDLLEKTDARGFKTQYTVDAETSRNTVITDRCGNKTAYEYDDAGRMQKVSNLRSNDTEMSHIEYKYDNFNNISEILRGDEMKYSLLYNSYHKLESIGVNGVETPLITYSYKNGNGRLKQISYANGYSVKATYNGNGQIMTERLWLNNVMHNEYRYIYDNKGNLVRLLDMANALEYNYTYDSGRLIRSATFNQYDSPKMPLNFIEYIYNKEGRLSKKIVNDGENTVVYKTEYPENSNPIVKIEINGKVSECHSKTDALGRKVFDEIQTESGFISRQFSYYAGQITDEHKQNKKLKSSPTTNLVSQIILSDGRTISYEYDGEERITKVTDSIEGTTEYLYDEKGQLISEKHDNEFVNVMSYDNYGNILNKNGVAYTYDATWKDKLLSVGNKTITYDAQGNPITYFNRPLTWARGRHLITFGNVRYYYDIKGVRTGKRANGIYHQYIVDGTKVLKEKWINNVLIPLYNDSNDVCGINYNGVTYYFLKNIQNDVIAILNEEGETLARYSYDAWGMPTVECDNSGINISVVNPYRYRSYYYDVETELYYLQSRYYDPDTGRFINADSPEYVSVSGGNLFAYCKNCPVNRVDTLGFCDGPLVPYVNGSWYPGYNDVYQPGSSNGDISGGSSSGSSSIDNSFEIDVRISKTIIKLGWLPALIIGVIFLIIRLFLFYGGMFEVHDFTNYLPTSIAIIIAFYIPLNVISELISAVCNITNLAFFVTTLISIIGSCITGGIAGIIGEGLKLIFIKVGKVVLSYIVPAFYDIINMLQAAVDKKGCIYEFKLIGGGSIRV